MDKCIDGGTLYNMYEFVRPIDGNTYALMHGNILTISDVNVCICLIVYV